MRSDGDGDGDGGWGWDGLGKGPRRLVVNRDRIGSVALCPARMAIFNALVKTIHIFPSISTVKECPSLKIASFSDEFAGGFVIFDA